MLSRIDVQNSLLISNEWHRVACFVLVSMGVAARLGVVLGSIGVVDDKHPKRCFVQKVMLRSAN